MGGKRQRACLRIKRSGRQWGVGFIDIQIVRFHIETTETRSNSAESSPSLSSKTLQYRMS